jgi:hypothetical protein
LNTMIRKGSLSTSIYWSMGGLLVEAVASIVSMAYVVGISVVSIVR